MRGQEDANGDLYKSTSASTITTDPIELQSCWGRFKKTCRDCCRKPDHDPHHDELIQEAEAYMKTKMPGAGSVPLLRSTPAVFAQWGTGIELYFRFTRTMMFITFITAVFYVPLLVCNLLGDSLRLIDMSNAGFIGEMLARTMLPNLGSVEVLSEPNTSDMTNFTLNTTNVTITAGYRSDSLYGLNVTYERSVKLIGKVDIKTMTCVMGFLDALSSLLVLLAAFWFEYHEIPRCVASHRNEFVTPQIYSVYVDCLPKRLFGGGGHEAYSKRLKQHFELLLEAQVTTKSATLKMTVVSADEQWCRRPLDSKRKRCCNLRWCPTRADGYDSKGRRTGHIVKMSGTTCIVEWHKTEHDESFPQKRQLSNGEEDGDLLDASLLWRLEAVGLNPVPSGDKAGPHEAAVYAVSLQRDFDQMLAKLKAKSQSAERNLEKKLRTQKGRTHRSLYKEQSDKRKMEMDLDFNAEVKLEDRDVVGAFVIFSHTQYRDFIHSEYRFTRTPLRKCLVSRRLLFAGQALRVKDAQAPSDVFWKNLDFPEMERWKRRILVVMCCILIMAGVVFSVAFAKMQAMKSDEETQADCDQGTSTGTERHHYCMCIAAGYQNVMLDEPSGIYDLCKDWLDKKWNANVWNIFSSVVVIATTGVGGFFVGYLALLLKPTSLSDLNKSILHMTVVVYVLCLGIINVTVNCKSRVKFLFFGNGQYPDLTPNWYVAVGSTLLLTLCANSFYPIVSILQGPLNFLYVRFMKKRKRLMIDLMELHTPPDFPFALRHAEQVSQVLSLMLFCGGMPVLALMIPISYSLFYWCDKWTFLRASKTPPRYNASLMLRQVQILQIGVWLHSSWSAWSYSNQETSPSYCTFCYDNILGIPVSSADEGTKLLARMSARLSRLSAYPNSIISLCLILTLVLRLVFFIVGHNMIVWLEHHIPTWLARFLVGGDFDEFDPETSFVNELSSMSRRGVPISYDIDQVKGYEFLNGCRSPKSQLASPSWRWRHALELAHSPSELASLPKAQAVDNVSIDSTRTHEDLPLESTIVGAVSPVHAAKKTVKTYATATSADRRAKRRLKLMSTASAGDARDRADTERVEPRPAAPDSGETYTAVSVDALSSAKGRGKGKSSRPRRKLQGYGTSEAHAISTEGESLMRIRESEPFTYSSSGPAGFMPIPSTPGKAISETAATAGTRKIGKAVGANSLQSRRAKQGQYLSAHDPFPKPDDLEEYAAAIHNDDLGAIRERLGIRRTRHAQEAVLDTAKKFKMKGKGKGKPAASRSELTSDSTRTSPLTETRSSPAGSSKRSPKPSPRLGP